MILLWSSVGLDGFKQLMCLHLWCHRELFWDRKYIFFNNKRKKHANFTLTLVRLCYTERKLSSLVSYSDWSDHATGQGIVTYQRWSRRHSRARFLSWAQLLHLPTPSPRQHPWQSPRCCSVVLVRPSFWRMNLDTLKKWVLWSSAPPDRLERVSLSVFFVRKTTWSDWTTYQMREIFALSAPWDNYSYHKSVTESGIKNNISAVGRVHGAKSQPQLQKFSQD